MKLITYPTFFIGKLMHHRLLPKKNFFLYNVLYIQIPISKIDDLSKHFRFLSLNKINLFSLYKKDYGKKDGTCLKKWAISKLKKEGIRIKRIEIVLQTFPRILGYVFNPVNFWYCFTPTGMPLAIIVEVNNTFSESYSYIIKIKDNKIANSKKKYFMKKKFYVSPFFNTDGGYYFKFNQIGCNQKVTIDYHVKNECVLKTHILGKSIHCDDFTILKIFFSYPLMTIFITLRIHFQALKLWIKGLNYVNRNKISYEGRKKDI